MSVRGLSTLRPLTRTTPLDGETRPAAIISSVLLPQPLGPTWDKNSPRRCVSEISLSARTSPSRVAQTFDRFSTRKYAVAVGGVAHDSAAEPLAEGRIRRRSGRSRWCRDGSWSSGAVTPPYCLSTSMVAAQSASAPSRAACPWCWASPRSSTRLRSSRLMIAGSTVSEYFFTIATASSMCCLA